MRRGPEFVQTAELAARKTAKEWIRQALRECFLQGLRQAWNVGPKALETNKNEEENGIEVKLSLSALNACFAFVERLSQTWQTRLKEEQHERVARWVAQVYRDGKSSLWTEQGSEVSDESSIDEDSDIADSNEQQPTESSLQEEDTRQTTDKPLFQELTPTATNAISDGGDDQGQSSSSNHDYRPNAYCKLRALGRRRKIDSPVLPIADGLQEIKEFTQNHSTYWPLSNDIIDQACSDLSRRMRARDKHGSGGSGGALDGGKSFTKKTVRFKVLPKSVWETKQQQERSEANETDSNGPILDGNKLIERNDIRRTSSSVETALLASIKRKKSDSRSNTMLQKKSRISDQQETSRMPFDVPQNSEGGIRINVSLQEKRVLDGLLILDDEDGDVKESQTILASKPEVTLGLFGGLKHVGETNHLIENPGYGSDRTFLAKGNDKMTRRREKISIQERLDPNRLQIGRAENPSNRKTKIFRTEDWFDDQMKFFDFDLGWCLLEMPAERNQKRLCAFSSMEICLEDRDK